MMKIRFIISALLAALGLSAHGQQSDSDDLELRVNPEMGHEDAHITGYSGFGWLNLTRNHINLNGADWSLLGDKLGRVDRRPLRIVLIGDSHIQADGATSVVRRMLHDRYGSAGRGMVTPLRLAGTNQPRDYRLTSTATGWGTARLVPRKADCVMLFTGVTACPADSTFDLSVCSTEGEFSRIKLYYCGDAPDVAYVVASDGEELAFDLENYDDGFDDILLERPVAECSLYMTTPPDGTTYIGGLELLGNDSGVEFSSIGNNGATFGSYLGLGTGQGLARMEADLVILSLGTNDAWGSMSDSDFITSVDCLVKEIQRDNPSVRLLLTTPPEAQKSLRRGRRGRVYTPHAKVAHFRDLILDYCRRNSLATYDFYDVAGGGQSSVRWLDAGLLSRDRIHLTWPGYALMGRLMADALIERLESIGKQEITSIDNGN